MAKVPYRSQKGPQLLGYRLDSADGLNVAQVRIDGFTFSRLMPYESWDRMVEDAWVVWKRYLATSRPLGIERIATPVHQSHRASTLRATRRGREGTSWCTGRQNGYLPLPLPVGACGGCDRDRLLATKNTPEPSMILDIDCFVRDLFRPTRSASDASSQASGCKEPNLLPKPHSRGDREVQVTPTAAEWWHPSPSYRQGSTDRGITKEARTVWMAILAAELSAWLTEQSYVRRQRELALDESFRDCSQPDWDGYGAAPANALVHGVGEKGTHGFSQ